MAQTARRMPSQQDMINRRLPFVIAFLVFFSGSLLFRLSSYQWLPPDVRREFEVRGEQNTRQVRRLAAERGLIYDRDGQPLAFNVIEYELGVSPILITSDKQARIARDLSVILQADELDIYNQISSPVNPQWELIAKPVSAELGQQIEDKDYLGVILNPLSTRFYPQGSLAGQLVGFVIEDNDNKKLGAMGVEGQYNAQLAGRTLDQTVSNIPFNIPIEEDNAERRGMDLVLTIDRDIQFWVEYELERAIAEQGATEGTVIVMNPRNGDILAMASSPGFDPNNFKEVEDPDLLINAAIGKTYEPGSVMKVLTVAGALESGAITPDWTYNDTGIRDVGGIPIYNSTRQAYGVVDTTTALVRSLNVGMTEIALRMGTEDFYSMMQSFGIGQRTNVDLPGEESGSLSVPGDPNWSESNLATNSFGQGVAVTPLQMLTAVSAIANDGLMMQPRIVSQIIDGETVRNAQLSARRVLSAQTADQVTQMMIQVVADPNGAPLAAIPGYTIAGKTGTAEIPGPTGYENGTSIVTFVGFFPADDPEVAVLVKLDRPAGYWGSQVAAPVFQSLAQRLVILMGIPNDEVRRQLSLQNSSGS